MKKQIGVPTSLAQFESPVAHPQIPLPVTTDEIEQQFIWYWEQRPESQELPALRGTAIVDNQSFDVFVTIIRNEDGQISLIIHEFADNPQIELDIDPSKRTDLTQYVMELTGIYLSLDLEYLHHYSQES